MAKKPKRKKPRKVTLKLRKQAIAAVLEDIWLRAPGKQRLKLSEHVIEQGLDLVSRTLDIDTSNAIVIFPDDPMAELLQTVTVHSINTKIPFDDIIEGLIATLAERPTPAVMN